MTAAEETVSLTTPESRSTTRLRAARGSGTLSQRPKTEGHKAKTSVSLDVRLLAFADRRASEKGLSRSEVIEQLLVEAERHELAAEGYRSFARESAEWAEAFPPVYGGDPDAC